MLRITVHGFKTMYFTWEKSWANRLQVTDSWLRFSKHISDQGIGVGSGDSSGPPGALESENWVQVSLPAFYWLSDLDPFKVTLLKVIVISANVRVFMATEVGA